jgi:hypothetical protein
MPALQQRNHRTNSVVAHHRTLAPLLRIRHAMELVHPLRGQRRRQMNALNIATIVVSALSITISAHTITTTKKRLAGIQSIQGPPGPQGMPGKCECHD